MTLLKNWARLSLVLAAIALPAPSHAQSQAWPTRPVKLLLPLGPGSGADIGARLYGERLSAKWGQPVVVENRPGGDGFVAIGAFTAAKDDHTLLWGPAAAFTAHPFLHAKLPYDPRDLAPIARVTTTLISISIPVAMKPNTMAELTADAKAQPGKFNWATMTGATDFVFAAWLKKEGIEAAKVPYRDPVSALNDLTESRIQIFSSAFAIVRAQIEAGRVKPLAMQNSERARAAPNIPTAAEAGTPDLTFDGLVGLYGLPSMPQALRERIAADLREVASDPAIVARMTATGQEVKSGNPAEFAGSIEAQRKSLEAAAQILRGKLGQ